MIVAIYQPVYLPWLGFFEKMRSSDVFVLLDDVPFSRNSIHNRNLIKTARGRLWLTVPVKTKGRFGQLINETEIDNSQNWARKHWETIRQNYHNSKHWSDHANALESIYTQQWVRLMGLNVALIKYVASALDIERPIVMSSSLAVKKQGTERIVAICKKLGADTYLSGIGARAYQDDSLFQHSSIKLIYQKFTESPYPQLYGQFISKLSALDYLLNSRGEDVSL